MSERLTQEQQEDGSSNPSKNIDAIIQELNQEIADLKVEAAQQEGGQSQSSLNQIINMMQSGDEQATQKSEATSYGSLLHAIETQRSNS